MREESVSLRLGAEAVRTYADVRDEDNGGLVNLVLLGVVVYNPP